MRYLPLLLLISCSRLIEIDSADIDPVFVVNSIILPDSTITVYVAKSVPYQEYSGLNWVTKDMEVALYKNGIFEEMLVQVDSFYKSTLRGEVGTHYEIRIWQAENNSAIISAATIVPMPVPIDTGYQIIGDSYASIDVKFRDNESSKNYYELMVYRDFTKHNMNQGAPFRISSTWSTNQIITRNGLDHTESYHTQLFSDEGFNGDLIQLTLYTKDSESFSVAEVFVVLYSIPKDYFEYKLSLVDQLWSRAPQDEYSSEDFINPKLFKAINPIDGNIQGGQGIFAGVSFSKQQCTVIW